MRTGSCSSCPKRLRIDALRLHPRHSLPDRIQILAVGHAVPRFFARQHLHACRLVRQLCVHHKRQEIFTLERIGRNGVVQKRPHTVPELIQHARRESPEVHRHNCITRQREELYAILGIFGIRALFVDLRALCHAGQHPVFDLTHAAGHGTELRHRVFQAVANHGVLARVGLRLQKAVNLRKGRTAIEIVRVDDGKRSVYRAPAAGQRVTGPPRLRPSFRNFNALRQTVKVLIYIRHMEIPLHAVANGRSPSPRSM